MSRMMHLTASRKSKQYFRKFRSDQLTGIFKESRKYRIGKSICEAEHLKKRSDIFEVINIFFFLLIF